MISLLEKCFPLITATLISLLLISGCQSVPANRTTFVTIDKAIPGEIARTKYAHFVSAIKTLDTVLSNKKISLDGIPWDSTLYSDLPITLVSKASTPAKAIAQLAEGTIVDAGPYNLVQADTLAGRIEYQSKQANTHLSITVRPPNERERTSGLSFVVTDMFSQISLTELVRAGDIPPTNGFGIVRVGQLNKSNDTDKLAYFESLPPVERDRADLLGLRAMLMMRLGNDKQALPLVKQGIIRYRDTPMFFVLAELLFQRTDHQSESTPEALSIIMKQRFDWKEIKATRLHIEKNLNAGAKL